VLHNVRSKVVTCVEFKYGTFSNFQLGNKRTSLNAGDSMGGRGGTWGPGVGGSHEVKQEGQNDPTIMFPSKVCCCCFWGMRLIKEKIKQIDSICIMKEVNEGVVFNIWGHIF